jgi:hypothetical protein
MLTAVPRQRQTFLSALSNLVRFHPAAEFSRLRARAAQRRADEALSRLPPHLRDDVGLLSEGASSTDGGLLELAMRSQGRWA